MGSISKLHLKCFSTFYQTFCYQSWVICAVSVGKVTKEMYSNTCIHGHSNTHPHQNYWRNITKFNVKNSAKFAPIQEFGEINHSYCNKHLVFLLLSSNISFLANRNFYFRVCKLETSRGLRPCSLTVANPHELRPN